MELLLDRLKFPELYVALYFIQKKHTLQKIDLCQHEDGQINLVKIFEILELHFIKQSKRTP